MKLQNEYEFIKNQFENNLTKINEYAPKLKQSNNYKDYDTRLIWDCLRAFIGSNTICNWYGKYDCNDKHITTVGKKVLKDLGVI